MRKVIYHYVKEQKVLFLSYLVLCLIFGVTFYLYDLVWASLSDAFLFSFFFLMLFTLYDFSRYYREYQALHILQKRSLNREELRKLPKGRSLLIREYQGLLQQTVKEKEETVQQVFETNQQLLDYYAMWSHQIKTPLAALDLLVQTQAQDTSLMKQELFKIDGYLEMMLHYIRMHHLNEDLVLEKVSLEPLVKEVVRKYAVFFIEKDLSVTIEPFTETVITDKKWLGFILEQLIFNSIKYTANGGLKLCFSSDGLIIQDSGIGILSQDLPRIFDKGYTGFNGRETQKATGLGLYMSHQIANRLGVSLDITSELGVGTMVKLQFPQEFNQLI